jgi:hypothetical protein
VPTIGACTVLGVWCPAAREGYFSAVDVWTRGPHSTDASMMCLFVTLFVTTD